ncbi:MAG TPA: hypothetical protein VM889_14075 [Candidatus Thermoplasmatota archaeon]|nr:hypothetical protein [Candidatus Thermoplasmatota archaeon]
MRLLAVLLAVLLVALAPAAAATYPERTFERTLTVSAAAGGNEVNLVLQSPGDFFRYEWSSGEVAIKFDIHTHVGSEVKTLKEMRGTGDKDVFTTSTGGIYSLFFQSLGDDAQVSVKIRGPFKLQGEPDPPAASSGVPGPGVALVALAAAGVAVAARRR